MVSTVVSVVEVHALVVRRQDPALDNWANCKNLSTTYPKVQGLQPD